MGYNIGLKPLMGKLQHEATIARLQAIWPHWLLDLTTVYLLEDIDPVIDATLLRIYAQVYPRDLTGLNEDKLKALATTLKPGLKAFVFKSIFGQLQSIIDRWNKWGSKDDAKLRILIPANCLNAFNSLINTFKLNPGSNLISQFGMFKNTLLNNAAEWDQTWPDTSTESGYVVPKAQFASYLELVARRWDDCLKLTEANETPNFRLKYQELIDAIKVLLLMVHQVKLSSKAQVAQMLLHDQTFNQLVAEELRAQATSYATRYANQLKPIHIVCMSPGSELDLPKVDTPETALPNLTNADEYLLLYTRYLMAQLKE